MEGIPRFTFLFTIFFFSGSVVLIGAYELRARTMRRGDGSSEQARQLIKDLRGDSVRSSEAKFVDPESMPPRKPGAYLQDHDKRKLNSLLQMVVPQSDE